MSFSVNHCIAERSTNAAMAIELLHDDGDYTQRDKTRHLIQYVLTYLIGWQQQYYYFSPFSFSEFIYWCCCYFLLLNCTQMRNIANHLCVFLYVAINFIKFSSFSLQKHNNWIVPMLEFQKQRYWTRRHSTMEPENAMQ